MPLFSFGAACRPPPAPANNAASRSPVFSRGDNSMEDYRAPAKQQKSLSPFSNWMRGADKAEARMSDRSRSRDSTLDPVRILSDYFGEPESEPESATRTALDIHIHKRPCVGDYTMVRVLGKGSFGKVILVRQKKNERLYAMKVLKKQNVVKRDQVAHTRAERRVLELCSNRTSRGESDLSSQSRAVSREDSESGKENSEPLGGYCPFIVQLHAAFQSNDKLYFVLDYCPGGELFVHLSRAKRFPEKVTRFYTAELILALEHLHAQGVVYRDMKPENVLLAADGHLKLVDFGLAKDNVSEATVGCTSFCGTPEYLAPEVLARTGHGQAVDWWGLGMLVYEMLTGLPPWYSEDTRQLMLDLRTARLDFPPYVSGRARVFIAALLNRNAAKRLGATFGAMELKRHDFFVGVAGGTNWMQVAAREVPVPIDPSKKLTDECDVSNFHKQFTRLPLESKATATAAETGGKGGAGVYGGGSGLPGLFGRSSNKSKAKSTSSSSRMDQFSGFTFGTYGQDGVGACAQMDQEELDAEAEMEAETEVETDSEVEVEVAEGGRKGENDPTVVHIAEEPLVLTNNGNSNNVNNAVYRPADAVIGVVDLPAM